MNLSHDKCNAFCGSCLQEVFIVCDADAGDKFEGIKLDEQALKRGFLHSIVAL